MEHCQNLKNALRDLENAFSPNLNTYRVQRMVNAFELLIKGAVETFFEKERQTRHKWFEYNGRLNKESNEFFVDKRAVDSTELWKLMKCLKSIGYLGDFEYSRMNALRDIRNSAIHRSEEYSDEQTLHVFHEVVWCFEFLEKQVGLGFSGELQKFKKTAIVTKAKEATGGDKQANTSRSVKVEKEKTDANESIAASVRGSITPVSNFNAQYEQYKRRYCYKIDELANLEIEISKLLRLNDRNIFGAYFLIWNADNKMAYLGTKNMHFDASIVKSMRVFDGCKANSYEISLIPFKTGIKLSTFYHFGWPGPVEEVEETVKLGDGCTLERLNSATRPLEKFLNSLGYAWN